MCDYLDVDREALWRRYGRNAADVARDVAALNKWLASQAHLPALDDGRIERMLLNNKFSMERTKRTIDMYFTMRGFTPALLTRRDPARDDLQEVFKAGMGVPLPRQTPGNGRVVVYRLLDPDPDKYEVLPYFKVAFMTEDVRLRYDYSFGTHLLLDYHGTSFTHMTRLTPADAIKINRIWTECYKNKVLGVHILNEPSYSSLLFSLVNAVMKPKIVEKIIVHPNIESLYEYIPRDILPSDYGGSLKSIKELTADWASVLEREREWFVADDKLRADESKRAQRLNEDVFGSMHGSFRKLRVD